MVTAQFLCRTDIKGAGATLFYLAEADKSGTVNNSLILASYTYHPNRKVICTVCAQISKKIYIYIRISYYIIYLSIYLCATSFYIIYFSYPYLNIASFCALLLHNFWPF